jgi:hypothetical protein
VSHHFSCHDIKGLYIDSCLNKTNDSSNANDSSSANDSSNANANDNSNNNICNDNAKCSCCSVKTGKYIPVPMSSLKTIRQFVYENISAESRNLVPIYPIPIPVVYRIYLDDGHCHGIN